MIVKLFDKTEIRISDAQADRLKQAIARGAKHIEVNDTFITTSNIASIVPDSQKEFGDFQIDKKMRESRAERLIGGGENRGNESPIKELIKSKRKLGKSWAEIAKEL